MREREGGEVRERGESAGGRRAAEGRKEEVTKIQALLDQVAAQNSKLRKGNAGSGTTSPS